MKRILLTGMSGVGKSTVGERLSDLGFKAVDTSNDGYSVVDARGIEHWDLDRIRDHLLANEDVDVLFVIGTDEQQGLLYLEFDHVVLLSAPREVVVDRITSRTNNPFGQRPDELAKILSDIDIYEPIIRRTATHEIDTNKPIDQVIEEILTLVDQPPAHTTSAPRWRALPSAE